MLETRVVCLFIHKTFLNSEKKNINLKIEFYFENFFLQENTEFCQKSLSLKILRDFSLEKFFGDAI